MLNMFVTTYLEDTSTFCNHIKRAIESFQQLKDFDWTSGAAPLCESRQIRKENGGVFVQRRNRSAQKLVVVRHGRIQKLLGILVLFLLGLLFLIKLITNLLRKERIHNCTGSQSSSKDNLLSTCHDQIINYKDKGGKQENARSNESSELWIRRAILIFHGLRRINTHGLGTERIVERKACVVT